MKTFCLLLLGALAFATPSIAGFPLASQGQPRCAIYLAPNASPTETNAAAQLALTLQQITGATFNIQTNPPTEGQTAILVGPNPAAHKLFPNLPFEGLAPEETIRQTRGSTLLLTGGSPRGTLYAVNRFLQDQCGVRWWTPWASHIPKNPDLAVADLDLHAKPAFEMREPFWFPAFNPEWATRNCVNGQSTRIPDELGGCVRYRGFVHTFYPLVPPAEQFAAHPEWFSLINGKRTTDHAQLCLTNPKLRDFVVERVKQWLRESPEANIISISQNDWHGACQCDPCKAIDSTEGSHAGSLLDFVNYVADKIAPDFPKVAIDTLAYQYTRKPPKTIRPRPNVIVRLCSIECNFRQPLDHPSNASFADDIRGWAAIAPKLYIWDYTTDFAHYVQPHPNWFTLGANVRFFHKHNVHGLFEQGAYQSHGSEMAELRAWLLAQLLWNPDQDDRALIREFLDGYYGPAAPHILRYMELLHQASAEHNLTCYSNTDAPFLRFATLSQAEQLWQKAEQAVADDPNLTVRVKLGHLPVRYVWLARWDALHKEATDASAQWPLPDNRQAVAEEWRAVATGQPDKPWSRVTLLNEGGLTVDQFLKRFQ